jgi:uncharacterized protein YprB with RNaseH-like and TPR domain
MSARVEAYLDIETTGLSPCPKGITVIGIYRHDGMDGDFIQLVGEEVTADNLLAALEGVDTVYTYNGSRFDLPFIHQVLGVNLVSIYEHRDLMYDCWARNLRGGFKAVECQLGIERELKGVNGYDAVILWWRWVHEADEEALDVLCRYNKEDVVNLKTLRDKLEAGVRI